MITSVNLPCELLRLLKDRAIEENRSVSSLIRVLLVQALTFDKTEN